MDVIAILNVSVWDWHVLVFWDEIRSTKNESEKNNGLENSLSQNVLDHLS